MCSVTAPGASSSGVADRSRSSTTSWSSRRAGSSGSRLKSPRVLSGPPRRDGCSRWRSRWVASSRSTPMRTHPGSWTGSSTAVKEQRSAASRRSASSTRKASRIYWPGLKRVSALGLGRGALLRDELLHWQGQHVDEVLVDRVGDEHRASGVQAQGQDTHRVQVVVTHAALTAVATDALGAAAAYESPHPATVGENGGLPCLFAGNRADVLVQGPRGLQDLVVERGSRGVVAARGQPRHRG